MQDHTLEARGIDPKGWGLCLGPGTACVAYSHTLGGLIFIMPIFKSHSSGICLVPGRCSNLCQSGCATSEKV